MAGNTCGFDCQGNNPPGFLLKQQLIPAAAFPEEEKYYLQKLANGDEEARSILIERNLRLVPMYKKFENTREEQEDLISIGTVG